MDNGNVYVYRSKTYTYNDSNLVETFIDSISQSSMNSWHVYKDEDTYNSSNNLFLTVKSYEDAGQYIYDRKIEHFYNLNGELDVTIFHTFHTFHTFSGMFIVSGKEDYTYDTFGNTISETNYSMNSNGVNFSFYRRIIYNYDSNNEVISIAHEVWDAGDQDWKYDCGDQLCSMIVGVEDEWGKDISIYPNPTSSIVNIENIPLNSKVKVYNMLGTLMYESKTQTESFQLNISQLGHKGVYFVQVSASNSQLLITKRVILI